MKTPITPEEAKVKKIDYIPECIIESFNELIAKNIRLDGSSSFKQDEVINLAWTKADHYEFNDDSNLFRNEVFSNKWLDIEDLYKQYGWKVTHDKPAYSETYSATFEFEPAF